MGTPELSVRPTADRARALSLIERASTHAVGGAATVADLVSGCALFDVVNAQGRVVAAFAVRVDQYEAGRELSVTAAGGEAHARGATEAMSAWAEAQARDRIGARVLTCETQRPGLVRKLQRLGYRVSGYVLTKEI